MKKWEYKIIDSNEVPGVGIFKGKTAQKVEGYLNEMGQQGWEIVNIDVLELEGRLEFVGIAKRERQ